MITIDRALEILTQARAELGGDACLILSLTQSEIEDVDVAGLSIVREDESRYVQVEATHPALVVRENAPIERTAEAEAYSEALHHVGPVQNWERDEVQFPRLLAEIRAIGLTDEQVDGLCASMDLNVTELDELLERAETAWEAIKTQPAREPFSELRTDALLAFVEAIEATGGVVYDVIGGAHTAQAPSADEGWINLGTAYMKACLALGREPMVKP